MFFWEAICWKWGMDSFFSCPFKKERQFLIWKEENRDKAFGVCPPFGECTWEQTMLPSCLVALLTPGQPQARDAQFWVLLNIRKVQPLFSRVDGRSMETGTVSINFRFNIWKMYYCIHVHSFLYTKNKNHTMKWRDEMGGRLYACNEIKLTVLPLTSVSSAFHLRFLYLYTPHVSDILKSHWQTNPNRSELNRLFSFVVCNEARWNTHFTVVWVSWVLFLVWGWDLETRNS